MRRDNLVRHTEYQSAVFIRELQVKVHKCIRLDLEPLININGLFIETFLSTIDSSYTMSACTETIGLH